MNENRNKGPEPTSIPESGNSYHQVQQGSFSYYPYSHHERLGASESRVICSQSAGGTPHTRVCLVPLFTWNLVWLVPWAPGSLLMAGLYQNPYLFSPLGRDDAPSVTLTQHHNSNVNAGQVLPSKNGRRRPLLEIAAATDSGDETGGVRGTNSSTSNGQSQHKKKRRQPRYHAPVEDAGGGVAGSESDDLGEEDEQPVTVDGSWQGAGPFVGMDNPPSPMKEPTFEDRVKFGKIMEEILGTSREEELPSKLTPHIEFLMSVDVPRLTNELISQEPTVERVRTLHNAYDFVVTFLEEVTENALVMQKEHRGILREMIEAAKTGPGEFDGKMRELQERFSYEFVKYLDAEIARLEKIDTSPGPGGGSEVLNVMKLVRTRVCAEVDLLMGEDVAFLTRLLSYDDRYMMRAAMRALVADKSPEEILSFRKLVDSTLKDMKQMDGVDPILRRKLADISSDVVLLERDAEAMREATASQKADN